MGLFTDLVDAKFSCVPVRLDGSKAPAIPSWKEFETRLPTPSEAQDWDRRHRAAGIICGSISGSLECIDIDEPSLARPFVLTVRREAPDLYERLTLHRTPRRNETGQAGCHIVYRCPGRPIGGNQKLAMTELEPDVDDQGQPVLDPKTGEQRMTSRCLIETRSNGGYFITPGSAPEVHSTGRPYEHAHGPTLLDVQPITAEERDFLLRLARSFNRSVAESHVEPKTEGYLRGDDRPGDAFAQRTSWADILIPAGWTNVGESAGITRWRRPGKTSSWSATTGVLSKQGTELFCVFTSNAHPFPGPDAGRNCSTHSKFDAYAILNHGGDHQAAARALADLGFGTPPRKQNRPQRVLAQTLANLEIELLNRMREGIGNTRSTGIRLLDEALMGGIEPGEVVLIGGPTSHGKTVLGMTLARHEVCSGRNAIIVSEEMAGTTLAKRSLQSRIYLPPEEWPVVADKIERESRQWWSERGTVFVLESCRTMDRVEESVTAILGEFDAGMIVLDYAQLITTGKSANRYESVTDTSARFAAIVRKHRMVGVLLAQFNRESAKGGAQIHSFKDSSQLEQDADVVLLIEWLAKTNPDHPRPRDFQVRIPKNRNRGIRHPEIILELRPESQNVTDPPLENRHEEFDHWNET